MPDKAMAYVRMAEDTAKQITGSYERWTAFLTTAARVYKYPYTEQLMIFAQKPDATACAEYGLWTNTMRRYVRRGSKGIALIDTTGETPRIRYVFDISDTGGREDSRRLNPWSLNDDNMDTVLDSLHSQYDETEPSLPDLLETIATRLSTQYWEENKEDILDIVDGSFLEEYDEYNVGTAFRQAASVSITYMLMSRCGLEPENHFGHEDFMSIFDFNTPETVAALGTAVSQISQTVLRQIEVTIRNAERRMEYERNDEQPDLSAGRGRAAAQRDLGRDGNGEVPGQVRQDAEEIPDGASTGAVQHPDRHGEIAEAPAGDRGDSAGKADENDARNAEESGPDRANESRESDGMGGPDERPERPGRGNPDGGVDLQLKDEQPEEPARVTTEHPIAENAEEDEPSAFSVALQEEPEQAGFDFPEMQTEQQSFFGASEQPAAPVQPAEPRAYVSIQYPPEVVDTAMSIGANDRNSRLQICAFFMKDKSVEENAEFLKNHYGTNGAGFYFDDCPYAIWYSEEGLRLSMGTSAFGERSRLYLWEQVAVLIRRLLDEGRYLPQYDLDMVPEFERREIGAAMLHLHQDVDKDAESTEYLPALGAIANSPDGFPEAENMMAVMLTQPDAVRILAEEMEEFTAAYAQNRNLLRFHYHRPQQVLTRLRDLQQEQITFTAAPDFDPQRKFFISDDEIDRLLLGRTDDHEYRLGVYSCFLSHSETKDREGYMKSIHGEYSGSYSGNNNILYTRKGIEFSHGTIGSPYAEVKLTWNAAVRRIEKLIEKNQFLSDADRAAMPEYERKRVAQAVVNGLRDAPDYIPRPYTGNTFTDYWENIRQVQAQLTDPARIEAIFASLVQVMDMTLPNDRNYSARQQAVQTLEAYRDGTYTLFGEKREPVVVQNGSTIESANEPELPGSSSELGQEAEEQETPSPSHETKSAENYKLGFGHMGNGLTVWNSLEYEHGDYKTVAHIAADRTVTFYDDKMPESVRKIIIDEAETANLTISATQNDPVFSTPPRDRTLTPPAQEAQTQPEEPPVNADEKAPSQPSAESEEQAEASSPRTIAQEDIDEALREWNGIQESKQAVDRYMREHGRERGTAAWLRQEYGDDLPAFPVTTKGAAGDIPWTRVQRDLARLIQENRFLTEEEQQETVIQNEAQIDDTKQPNAEEPPADSQESGYQTPGGIVYHAGDSIDSQAVDGSIVRIVVDHVTDGYVWFSFPSLPDQPPVNVFKERFEEHLDDGSFRIISENERTAPATQSNDTAAEAFTTPMSMEAAEEYNDLKAKYPNALIGFEQHKNYEFYGDDAEKAAKILNARLLSKEIPGGHISVTGFPVDRWHSGFRQLWRKGIDVYLASEKSDGTHEEAKYLYGRDYVPLHATVHINQREYRVERVDYSKETVLLRDISSIPNPRFPLMRQESTEFVRSYLEEEPDIPLSEETRWEMAESEISANASEADSPASAAEAQPSETKNSDEPPVPQMMETVYELTSEGYQETVTRPVQNFKYDCMFHDIAYLDGQAYQVESVGLLDVQFQPLEVKNLYPVFRLESRERLETLLAQDSRNNHLLSAATLEQRQQARFAWQQKFELHPASQEDGSFEYQGYHFEPVGVFPKEMTFSEISEGTISNTELGMTTGADAPHPYSHQQFYEAAHDVNADLFRCLENGKLYMPGDNELFEYVGRFEPFRGPAQTLEQEKEEPEQEQVISPVNMQQAENYRISDDHLGEGGAKTKFKNNMTAIYTLKTLEAEGRPATPEEQEIMSRYVGWGGLANAFDPGKKDWSSEYEELKAALTPEEYKDARASTLNAHYTSPTVIRAVYEALGNMGFKKGNILEPAMGVGNFFGMLPESMRESKLYGVELDSITGRLAQKLYPKARITVAGFETTDRHDFYDVAVGNVPFGNYKVNDRAYNKLGFNIHNYFFAKSLDQVRSGGIVAFVTSRYTMDAKSPEVRKYLAQRAELLGAVRLPSNAFTANAGTEVTTDIIFLQKRDQPIDIEPDWVHLGETADGIPINSYYVDHPEMVLGTMVWEDKMYGSEKETACQPIPGADLGQMLSEAVKHITGTYREAELPELEEGEEIMDSLPADPNVANYSYTVVDGKVYYREDSIMVRPQLNQTAQERTAGMVELRDCVHQLMDAQLNDAPDQEIQSLQSRLNTLYDAFTAKYGLINSRGNAQAFSADSSYYLLCSLEVLDENGNLERKADMFFKRTIRQQRVVDHVDTAVEALALSISERAKVDLQYMAHLTGKSEEEIISDLTGVIFRLPEPAGKDGRSKYVTADEYLSGNVRQKLRIAQSWAESDDSFQVNVKALEAVQPKDLSASEIDVRLGATWIDKKYIRQFMYEAFHTPLYKMWNDLPYASNRHAITVNYSPVSAEWNISNKSEVSYNDVTANTTFGTSRVNAYEILEAILNLRDVRIFDTVKDEDGKEKRKLNQKETTLAQQKQQAIKDAFRDWIWKDPDRREDLVHVYNERFNSTRPREYDGSHISFVGMNPEIELRPHQRNAIAHILYGGNTLLAHQVGAGKTFEMAAAIMESKRLGLCNKAVLIVPNHLTEQWSSEFLRLYPTAKLLVTRKKDFEKKNRKKFCARISTGDYDAVIIGHSQFEKIPISFERQERMLQEQIRQIVEGIEELKYERGERFSIKQMERTKKGLEVRLEKLRADHKKDDVVTFEQLGVDRLYVDESHFYKNLFVYTKMSNVAGLSTAEAQKSNDMFLKCRYMDEITDGKGIVFATGTPISNSMVEMYTIQRYLQYETLKRQNMTHFDCWASTFGETVTALELAPEGTGYRARTRFAKFFNLPELMNMFKEIADVKTADQLNLPTPEAHYETIAVKPSDIQKRLIQSLSERAAAVHAHIVDPSIDNMLKITSDGRKLGLDQRLIDPMMPDHPESKVNACVDNIMRIWQEGQADKKTQLVFCDLSTPKTNASSRAAASQQMEEANKVQNDENIEALESANIPDSIPEPMIENVDQFSVYDDIRSKLISRGVPPEEIAYIHDANTEAKKKDLFAKVRSGQVSILLGSTTKMGAGTNCQDRLIALHDLDAPWRPGDLEQRAGRIVRQGNKNKEVFIYRYVTEASFDAFLWQTLENKQKFISQIMTSKSPVRSCEDVDEAALSYAEIKALCAGDPRIKEKMDLDIEVSRLRLMKADHETRRFDLEDQVRKGFPKKIRQSQERIEGYQKDLEGLAAHPVPEKGFAGMTVDGAHYTEKDKAGQALIEFCKHHFTTDPVPLGEYRGFSMKLEYDPVYKRFEATLKGTMSYRVELGSDVYGNLTRIDNVLKDIAKSLETTKLQLTDLENQMATAKEEMVKPFPKEEELQTKSARLAELNAELNMDGQQQQPEEMENNDAPEEESAKQSPRSILARLSNPCTNMAYSNLQQKHDLEAR